MNTVEKSPLGKTSQYVDTYCPTLLFPIVRATNRKALGITNQTLPPFYGADVWNSYEFSWLTPSGKPAVALVEFIIPADSTHIVESKSFKLYLNSFNQTIFESMQAVNACLVKDLSNAVGKSVKVTLKTLDAFDDYKIIKPQAQCIDTLEVDIQHYQNPCIDMLKIATNEPTSQYVYSNLLKSNCPVTGQPDWASVFIRYDAAQRLDMKSLLQYIISFRQHADFHEHCVEQIFMDLYHLLKPTQLDVYARYTRRGGLDINPYRTLLSTTQYENQRLIRQ